MREHHASSPALLANPFDVGLEAGGWKQPPSHFAPLPQPPPCVRCGTRVALLQPGLGGLEGVMKTFLMIKSSTRTKYINPRPHKLNISHVSHVIDNYHNSEKNYKFLSHVPPSLRLAKVEPPSLGRPPPPGLAPPNLGFVPFFI